MLAFLLAGVCLASWASRIPDAQAALRLDESGLGLVLLGLSAGAVIALPSSGWLASRIGAGRAVLGGAALVAVGLLVVGAGATFVVLPVVVVGLFLTGLGTGAWDVSMNFEGAEVERRLGRSIMPRFHAAFSLGTVAAAGLGALADWAGVSILLHLGLISALSLAGVWQAVQAFLPPESHTEHQPDPGMARAKPLAAWTEPRTLLVGVLVLAAAFTEGAANDWLALAVRDGYGAESWVGVLSLAAFLTAMTAGRVMGTRWLDRYGRVRVLWGAFALAALGSLLVVLGPPLGLWVAFLGSLLWGLGASLGFPVGMSAAADDPRHAAARMSVVASIGYTAFLAGPPVLGFLGDEVGVLRSLLLVGALALPAMLVVPATRPVKDLAVVPSAEVAPPGRG